MKKSKVEAVDKISYHNAFNQWLNASTEFFNIRNEIHMNEKWLKFANDLGLTLSGFDLNGNILVEVEDNICWKEAKKYYSINSFRVESRGQEV